MIIAISTHSESQQVGRFGHDFPVLLLDVEGQAVRSSRQLEPQAGCCRTLAQRLEGAEVLICTGLGQGAARHLRDFGVSVAVVPEGVAVAAALASWTSQALQAGEAEPTDCSARQEGAEHSRGHDHGDQREPEAGAHQCGCGGHEATQE